MRIAVIGTGISGNLSARLLHPLADLTVFESADHIGGHAQTCHVRAYGRDLAVDTGFMVFNDRTYPKFLAMLGHIGAAVQASDMSFSVRCDRTGTEYQGSDLNGLFAQRRNFFRPRFLRMLADILRFNRLATDTVTAATESIDQHQTLGDFVRKAKLSQAFIDLYLVPMGAAIWSARPEGFLDFPCYFILRFFYNHGLLQLTNRPRWMTVVGRSEDYVSRLVAPFRNRIRLKSPVQAVKRNTDEVIIQTSRGSESFDHVVFATHANQSLQLLGDDATDEEREILSAFPYQSNRAVLHTDENVMPRQKRAWASWNYHISRESSLPVSVTYDLSRLQNLQTPGPVCVSLNPTHTIDESKVLRELIYEHPVFGSNSPAAQLQHDVINGKNRTFFCGAYWGNGFHEDGVNSALAVARHFGRDLSSCTAASTTDTLRTVVANR